MFLFQMGYVVYIIKRIWAVKKKQYNSEEWSYWILSKSPKISRASCFSYTSLFSDMSFGSGPFWNIVYWHFPVPERNGLADETVIFCLWTETYTLWMIWLKILTWNPSQFYINTKTAIKLNRVKILSGSLREVWIRLEC